MSTPQDSPRRRKQKARRTKQLLEWRIKKATEGTTPAAVSASASAKVAKVAPKAVVSKPTK